MLITKLIKIVIIFTSVLIILWIIKPLYLKPFGKFLVYNSPQTYKKGTKIADAAIVLTGGSGNRINEAISLYLNKNVDHILISGDEGKSKFMPPLELELKKHAINSGVNEKDIIMERQATSTYENAYYSLKLCDKLNLKKIIIVTNKFHSKRAFSIFQKLNVHNTTIIYSKTATDHINYDKWWHNHNMTETIMIEWGKTVWYWLKY